MKPGMQDALETTVKILTDPEPYAAKEKLYLDLRTKEGRVYSDIQVPLLPNVPASHQHYREWSVRKQSAERLERYLFEKDRGLHILDLGCGNGWLSNRLCLYSRNTVFGLDMNMQELKQAAHVFADNKKLHFIYADIFKADLPVQSFDIIVIASAIQYFPELKALMQRLFELLKDQGEIHILDSPFYLEYEASAAAERTKEYYEQLGFPGMSQFYYHHLTSSLTIFNPRQKNFLPRTIAGRRIRLSKNPFPWYVIKKASV